MSGTPAYFSATIRLVLLFFVAFAPLTSNAWGESRAVAEKLQATFTNPILQGGYPDPSIVRVGDDFYLLHSELVVRVFSGIALASQPRPRQLGARRLCHAQSGLLSR